MKHYKKYSLHVFAFKKYKAVQLFGGNCGTSQRYFGILPIKKQRHCLCRQHIYAFTVKPVLVILWQFTWITVRDSFYKNTDNHVFFHNLDIFFLLLLSFLPLCLNMVKFLLMLLFTLFALGGTVQAVGMQPTRLRTSTQIVPSTLSFCSRQRTDLGQKDSLALWPTSALSFLYIASPSHSPFPSPSVFPTFALRVLLCLSLA